MALNDIKEITTWYNGQQKGLGKRFFADIKQAANSISINPFFASIKYDDVRKAYCKKFPYSLHYVINDLEHTVSVFAVLHTSRDPFG